MAHLTLDSETKTKTRSETAMLTSRHPRSVRLAITAVFLGILVSVGLLLTPSPASGHSYDECNAGEFCVFAHNHGYLSHVGGDWHDPSNDDPNWPCCGHHGVQNDDQAFINNETKVVRVFDGGTYTGGTKYCALSGSTDPDIPTAVRNDGNSHDVYTSSSCPAGDVDLP